MGTTGSAPRSRSARARAHQGARGANDRQGQAVEPLAPPDRSAFWAALANLLRQEPQPLGEAAVFRSAQHLLSTGYYKLSSAVGTPPARHGGRRSSAAGATVGKRSKLLACAAIK